MKGFDPPSPALANHLPSPLENETAFTQAVCADSFLEILFQTSTHPLADLVHTSNTENLHQSHPACTASSDVLCH